MTKKFVLSTSLATIMVTGCTNFEGALPAPENNDRCPVLESGNWKAKVTPVPGNPARSQLSVSGSVTMPTPGYTFGWQQGRLDRSAVPSFELQLTSSTPDGMVAQMLETRQVSYSGPAAAQRYRAITITCEGRVLGRVENVS